MKKWMYVIFPGVMLGIFLVVYSAHVKEAEAREVRREQVAKEKLENERRQKKEAEERAAVDAQRVQKQREEEDRKKEEDRRRRQEAADKEVRDRIAQYRGEADKSAKQAADLEIELDRLRKQRDDLSRQDFELAKQVELARVAKRNAELQQQHLTAMLAQRAQQSTMTRPPAPPPAAR